MAVRRGAKRRSEIGKMIWELIEKVLKVYAKNIFQALGHSK